MSIPSPMQLSEPAITVVNSTHASPTTDGWINTRGLVSFERATAHRRHSASSDADGLPLSQTSSLSHRTMARTTSGVRPSTTLSSQSSFHPDDVNASSTEKPFRTSFEDPHAGLVSLESNQTPNSMPSGQRCSPPRSQRDSANCSQVLETTLAKKSTTRKGYRKVNQYRLVDLLGSGAFSEVYLALDTDNKAFAIKVLDRHRLAKLHALTMERSKIEEKILLEIAVLKRLRHPNIIALHEVINDPESKELYLVLEFAMCGPIMLLDDAGNVRPDENNQVRLPEAEAARIVKALINAIRYAHYCGVAHRDIKPQNVLLSEHNEVKLADFGVSEMIEDMYGASAPTTTPSVTPSTLLGSPNQQPFEADPLVDDDVDVAADDDFTDVLRSHKLKFRPEGTVCFMAPEFLDATKHKEGDEVEMADLYAADIWSLGVTVYTMTIGELPWKANQAATLLEAIRSHPDLPFPSDCPASPLLRDFVRCCIRVNPGERVPLKMLAHHPWITGRGGSFTGGSNSSMGSSFAPRSLSAQDPDQVFRNFSFDAKSMPWAPNNSTSYNANNPNSSSYNMNNKSVLGLSVSFQEPPVCVSPSEVQNAITWRRQPSNASLDASRRGGDDNASMDTSSPLSGYPCPPAHLAGPRHLNYNTLHTTSPSGYMWHSPSSRQPSAANLGAPRIQLDPLDITATVKADDEADYEDLSPPALVTSSHVTTPSAQSNVFSSCAVTPQGVSIGPIALPTHPPLSTTEEEEEAVDADDDLAAVRRAFEEAVAEATRRPVRPMDPTDVTTSPAVDPKLMNMTSPRDPLSLSNTLMFTSRDAVPSSCLFSPTPVIPYASPPPASVEPPPLLE